MMDRTRLVEWYRRNRERSTAIFAMVDRTGYYDRPIPLRHPFVFYDGHLPAFSFLTLNVRALGEPSVDPSLERLFQRGIDPSSATDAARHGADRWPSPEAVSAFARACDRRVVEAIAFATLEDPNVPRLVRGQAVYTALEHEMMHHETLLYIVHQLDPSKKKRIAQRHADRASPPNELRTVAGGLATLGADRATLAFGWDNEFPQMQARVAEFAMTAYPVTNGDWLDFVADGGPVPPFWRERDGTWMLEGAFETLPLPQSWPVYVSQRQASAYAAWRGMRLPTEAEYHRAAFATPSGTERHFPWGDAAPASAHGNFGFERYDPEPVDEHPAGASAWGIYDLVGNGWEWTSTPFAPFDGFEPMASYPEYSADFFDGKHYVLKGASPVTSKRLIRRSFRNWFYDDYPYSYAKFRCVAIR